MSDGNNKSMLRRTLRAALLATPLIAGGCNAVVLTPSGDVAMQQRDLVLASTALMLLIILPVMALTVLVAWRYRASNKDATYTPDWDHSTSLELVIWSAPLLIIICLGALTWVSTHLLDPYRSLVRVGPHRMVAENATPLEVDVVALDWKWLFIYPQYGVATVNQLAAPVDRPIHFHITSSSVMNSFFIPALAGQIYAMPGMETQLSAVMNKPGNYIGFSANYSGAGFSDMHFAFHGLDDAGFARWIAAARQGGGALSRAGYLQLAVPSENVKPMHFAAVAPNLFGLIVNECVKPGSPCIADTMKMDRGNAPNPGAPVNDSPAGPQGTGAAKGAIFKTPEEMGTSPHMSAPRQPHPPENHAPGSMQNRNLSLNDADPARRQALRA